MTVNQSVGLVVTPGLFGETAHGSNLHSTKVIERYKQ
jgi:hypothetical protein